MSNPEGVHGVQELGREGDHVRCGSRGGQLRSDGATDVFPGLPGRAQQGFVYIEDGRDLGRRREEGIKAVQCQFHVPGSGHLGWKRASAGRPERAARVRTCSPRG